MVNVHRSIVALLILIVLGIAGGVWLSRESVQSPPSLGRPAQGPVLERALQSIAHGARGAPRDRWDPAYVAERLGNDPIRHLRWVRDRSVWIPYEGVLRGPMGVLMDGQGNSLDRTLLLASLLTHAGHSVRLAHGVMSDELAAELLPQLLAERREAVGDTSLASEHDWRRDVRKLAGAYGFDTVRVLRTISRRVDEVTGMFRELEARTDEQTQRLGRALPTERSRSGEPDRFRRAVKALRDHWWVQVQAQGRWVDLDILGDAQGAARVPVGETMLPQAIDSILYHRVAIRLVAERTSGDALAETKALEYTVRTADVADGPITLQVMPESWQPSFVGAGANRAAAFRTQMLEQRKWRAALTVGKTVVAQAVIERAGQARTAGGNPFGGLGGAITGALKGTEGHSGELSAAWLEYEILTPGQPASVTRRQLFDLVGPAARSSRGSVALELDEAQRLERSLALFRSTDILVVGSAVAPTYLLHLAAKAALANGNVLRAPDQSAGSTPTALLDRLNELATPLPSPLYTLAFARMPVGLERDVFLDRANVLTRHDYLARRGSGIEHLAATDIAANDVGVALDAVNAVSARRRQGVRDTNAEALVHGAPGPRGSVADAYAAGGRWVTVTSANDRFVATLPPDVRARVVDDVRAGHVVVVPTSAATIADAASTGWWRIDPVTGGTLGVSGTGWGQSTVEKAAIIMGAVAVGWTWEYLICSGSLYVPGANQTVGSAGGPFDWFATPLHARVAASDDCIFDAWVAGITSGVLQSMTVVWPFLISKIPALKFFERPAFATGDAAPEAIFGGGPGGRPAPPAPDKCPPGAGGAGAGPQPGEPAPETNPLAKTQPGIEAAPPVGEPAPAPAVGEPAPVPPGEPHPDQMMGYRQPRDPEDLAEMVSYADAQASKAQAAMGPARSRIQRASDAVAEAEQKLATADAASDGTTRGTPEAADAAGRAVKAEQDLQKAQGELIKAQQELAQLERAGAAADHHRRVQGYNDAAVEARDDYRAASERFRDALGEGNADFHSPEWEAVNRARLRYQQALKDLSAAELGNYPDAPPVAPTEPVSPAAPAGPGATQQMPGRPPVPGQPPSTGPGATQPLGGSPTYPGGKAPGPVTPPGGPGKTQPLGNSPTTPGCRSAASPPSGSPPPGTQPPGAQPAGRPAGNAPAGTGPFKGDPENRKWLRENWDPDPVKAHDAARPLGDPAIYDNADQAALARYNQARSQGMDDQAARQESWDTWWKSVQSERQARGIYSLPENPFFEWVGNGPPGSSGTSPESHAIVGAGAMAGEP